MKEMREKNLVKEKDHILNVILSNELMLKKWCENEDAYMAIGCDYGQWGCFPAFMKKMLWRRGEWIKCTAKGEIISIIYSVKRRISARRKKAQDKCAHINE